MDMPLIYSHHPIHTRLLCYCVSGRWLISSCFLEVGLFLHASWKWALIASCFLEVGSYCFVLLGNGLLLVHASRSGSYHFMFQIVGSYSFIQPSMPIIEGWTFILRFSPWMDTYCYMLPVGSNYFMFQVVGSYYLMLQVVGSYYFMLQVVGSYSFIQPSMPIIYGWTHILRSSMWMRSYFSWFIQQGEPSVLSEFVWCSSQLKAGKRPDPPCLLSCVVHQHSHVT